MPISAVSLGEILKSRNIALLGRDVFYAVSQTSPIQHSGISTNLHEPCVFLDMSVYNTDTADHYVYIDGIPILVKAGGTTSISDTPFITFSTDPSASAWVVRLSGVSLASLGVSV